MKVNTGTSFFLAATLLAVRTSGRHILSQVRGSKERTITKVVGLLEDMLEKSKSDAEVDAEIFAKFQCYCRTNQEEKSKEVEELKKETSLLGCQIDGIKGETGKLATQLSGLKSDLDQGKQAKDEAVKLRSKAADSYQGTVSDLEQGITAMKTAIDSLSDASAAKSASLLRMSSQVKKALIAASGLADAKQRAAVESFLQTGSPGNEQVGEVIGVVRHMKDTFQTNLDAAQTAETQAIAAHKQYLTTQNDGIEEMSKMFEAKTAVMAENDADLASKKAQLGDASSQQELDERFLAQLTPMCEEKSKEYEKRKALRANEDAAVTEAISLLNSEDAFRTFGKVSATSTGSTADTGGAFFLQVAKPHTQEQVAKGSIKAERLLQDAAAAAHGDFRLATVVSMLEVDEPIKTVVDKITQMLDVITAEGESDDKKLAWCKQEQKNNADSEDKKKATIVDLTDSLERLKDDIEAPETGLRSQVESTEKSLDDNFQNQKASTAQRTKENLAYQRDVADLVKAEELITSAMRVLKQFYGMVDDTATTEEASPNKMADDSTAPSTWEAEKGYKGQSTQGKSVLTMMEFILGETQKEEQQAHADEEEAQASFEDTMAEMKTQQEGLQKSLVNLQSTLADKENDLSAKKKDLKATTADSDSIKSYLASIKQECDFIAKNLKYRNENRDQEAKALRGAKKLLQDTPVYKAATS